MNTAIALLAAALSVAALSTNASALRLTANTGGVTGAKLSSSSVAERNGMNGVSLKDTGDVGFNPQPQPPGKSNSTAMIMGTNYGDVMTRAENNVDYDVGSSEILVKTYCTGHCVHDDQGADTSFGTRSGGGFKLASNKAELGTGAIGIIHPSYVPNPNKLWGLDEDSLTEGSAGEIDILSNTSIVLGDEAIGIIHPDYVPIDPEVPGEAIGVIHPDYVPIDPEEVPGEAMAYRLIASLIEGDPDRPNTTSMVAPTGETQGSNVATATEYDLITALIAGTADPGGEGTYTTTTGEADAAKTFDYCVIYPERCTVSQIERPTFGPHMVTFDNVAGSADPGGDDI
jgi:hypothetical protein